MLTELSFRPEALMRFVMAEPSIINLFSYGTLRYEKVQLATFGRLLEGRDDAMPGYRLEMQEIIDPDVIQSSGERFHPLARRSDNPADVIEGRVFDITSEEIIAADRYEVAEYTRIQVTLRSGLIACVYVSASEA
jgi:hypothetical protein